MQAWVWARCRVLALRVRGACNSTGICMGAGTGVGMGLGSHVLFAVLYVEAPGNYIHGDNKPHPNFGSGAECEELVLRRIEH